MTLETWLDTLARDPAALPVFLDWLYEQGDQRWEESQAIYSAWLTEESARKQRLDSWGKLFIPQDPQFVVADVLWKRFYDYGPTPCKCEGGMRRWVNRHGLRRSRRCTLCNGRGSVTERILIDKPKH